MTRQNLEINGAQNFQGMKDDVKGYSYMNNWSALTVDHFVAQLPRKLQHRVLEHQDKRQGDTTENGVKKEIGFMKTNIRFWHVAAWYWII